MPPQPAPSLIAAICAELAHHAPFDAIKPLSLQYVAEHLSLVYFAKGAKVLSADDGMAQYLFVVQKGVVSAYSTEGAAVADSALTLSAGECFPVGALISRRPTALHYVAAGDTFCYRLPLAAFEHLMNTSRPFRDFCTRRLGALLDQSRERLQARYNTSVSDAHRLTTPLKSILRRLPVTVAAGMSIRAVLETMQSLRIGAVVVIDAQQHPVGIFTERDVLDRVALAGAAQDAPIAQVMTLNPFTLPATAPMFEAANAMARHRFRHVLVMEEGHLIGVVSERDLFTLQRLSLGEIAKSIEQATDVDALARASHDVRRLGAALLSQGVGGEQLTQFVTTLNDALVGRALALASQEAAPPAVPWCWLGLGSEGRMEQTMATDQDNAIVFSHTAADDVSTIRAQFIAFADIANRILDRVGFPLCKGDIMARNPKWCLTIVEWQDTFQRWLQGMQPEALLNAAIFFDFRALHGDTALAQQLRDWLTPAVASHSIFLLQMANNALQVRPPLGLVRDFVTDVDAYPGTIDLKKFGARPFIDAARIFALRHGIVATNTAERIRLAAPRMRMADDEAAALIDGFHFVQLLRLRNQEAEVAQTSGAHSDSVSNPQPNRINPDDLNELDRRILKEALRQARKLQSRLELDFPS